MNMEKTILVHLSTNKKERAEAVESIKELRGLARTAGAEIVWELFQFRPEISPKFFIGEGKVEEIIRVKQETQADLVIFENSSHLAHFEEPDAFYPVLSAFLERNR